MDYRRIFEASDIDVLWSGTVRLDRSLADCLRAPTIRDGYSVYAVRDSTYGRENNVQFDNPGSLKKFPNTVTVVAEGWDGAESLQCSAFVAYGDARDCLLRRGTKREVIAKGFTFEPLSGVEEDIHSRIAKFQFDNGSSANEAAYHLGGIGATPPLEMESLGCVAFASGSDGSSVTFARDPKRSVTVVFVASDRKPFVARIGSADSRKQVTCRCSGFVVEEIDPAGHDVGKATPGGPLDTLNIRLAKGEITVQEYEGMRRVMEGSGPS